MAVPLSAESDEMSVPIRFRRKRNSHRMGCFAKTPESETIWLTFAPSGRALPLIHLLTAEIHQDDPELFYTISVKTQFIGVDGHIAILSLLKYVAKKYLTDVEVEDEGHYWETTDKAILEKRFQEYQLVFDKVHAILDSATFTDTDNTDSLADQLMALLQKRLQQE